MGRKKITPAIQGKFDYLRDESSKFDKYAISVDGILIGYLYLPKQTHLLPTNIYFKTETIVTTEY